MFGSVVVDWDDPGFDAYLEQLTAEALAHTEDELDSGLPAGLDGMEPGPALAVWLSTLDPDALSGHDRVIALQAMHRLTSHLQAKVYAAMASIYDAVDDLDLDEELVTDAAATEIRFALRLTRRAADTELDLALTLRRRLPHLWQSLAAGAIDVRRAKVIAHGTDHLTTAQARDVTDRALETASRSTTGQLGALVRKLCVDIDPSEAHDRFQTAVEGRRVVVEPTTDGTAHLIAYDLSPDRAATAAHHINRLARSLRTKNESRTMDQLRADVLCDLLTGTDTAGKGGVVTLTVDLETLTGLSDHPGDLAGYGPVISDIARQVTETQARAEWRFTVTHPDSGQPVAAGITRRRPTRPQRRLVEILHPTCITPGCRMSATACDLDHTRPWTEHGPTEIDNLAPLCRHDHRIRHTPGFEYTPQPDGDHHWTTPLGHTYTASGRSP